MENECKIVGSYGLLKSCNIHSPNPKSSCNNDINYLVDMIKYKQMFNGMSIYVCSDLLRFFVNIILPRITHKFVLLSGDSDMCIPIEGLNQREASFLLNSPLLLKWFAQNTRIQNDDRIVQLPIGLDYHAIFKNPSNNWKMPNESHIPKFQEEILLNIIANSPNFSDRKNKIYVNFSINNDRFNDRKKALNTIPKKLLDINLNFSPRTPTWRKMTEYKFILSPFGVGMDCHRTWESIALGCVPIVCAPNFKKLFEGFDVIIVNDWNEVTEELLNNYSYNNLNNLNNEKLTLDYWKNRILTGH